MTTYTSWGRRFKQESGLAVDLLRGSGEEKIATFGESTANSFDAAAVVGEQQWDLHFDIKGEASATLPDGRVFRASPGEKGFSRTARIGIDMAGTEMAAIKEDKNNWIIDDAASEKVAQFSGLNNGLRRSILEFEESTEVSREQEIFLSWIARKTLESRMLGSSRGLTLFLVILTPIVILLAFI